ncbi:hypothetical protein KGF57_004725 [Candida theae]|uniref:Uncharacterized protein n=1 Tax=Candida theae TaxID=1198502 RepID=A0AAD5BBB2_9ASCO|nr:uncharacterized protein KGF57_004725 [Candida theae]KAI5949515.1 hypothetical protein KGF57_004725 [Candida theae]
MTHLPSETTDFLKRTLELYNTISIGEIHVFTNDLQYVGTYNNTDQQAQPELTDAQVDTYRQLIEAIDSSSKKLVNFSSGPSERYICHVLEKFVILFRLNEGEGEKENSDAKRVSP